MFAVVHPKHFSKFISNSKNHGNLSLMIKKGINYTTKYEDMLFDVFMFY